MKSEYFEAAETETQNFEATNPTMRFGPWSMKRRTFLNLLSVGLSGLIALPVAVPFLGFLLQPILIKPPTKWVNVGKIDDFQEGFTTQITLPDPSAVSWGGMAGTVGAYLRRNSGTDFVVYSANCTHLGCPVRWTQSAELFLCPCHGGVFYRNGQVAGGPPPKPLIQFPVRTTKDGTVLVQALPSVLGVGVPKITSTE